MATNIELDKPKGDVREDDALKAYLDLLDKDIARGPAALVPVEEALLDRLEKLVANVKIDLEDDSDFEDDCEF